MGAYTDFMAEDAYATKHSGSGVEIVLVNEEDPTDVVIGAATGINVSEDFEVVPVEEAGNDGVDEIVQGRHSGSLTIQAFFTPEWNDGLPTRQTFIGKSYVILERIPEGRPGAGNVLNAYTGAKMSRKGGAHGARGAKTLDLAFAFERGYNGEEYADLSGVL
jgi:hypothetical protein